MTSGSPEGTRGALIDAGLRTFAASGYTRARLTDIAAEAELTTGAFYRHFQSKQDFFGRLVEDYANSLQERLNDASDLRSQLQEWVEVSHQYSGVIRGLTEVALPGTEAADMYHRLRDACASLLARHLQGMSSWRITHGSAVMLIDTLFQIVTMEVSAWRPRRDPADIARSLDRLVQKGLYVP
jgi:AcrR family transcriptional regulator